MSQNLKGFRDFLPEKAIARNFLIEKLKAYFERFGFDPLETPALEYAQILLGKYGDEADKLIYLFEDKGKRKVGLRYDQTVPLARVIAQYPQLVKPFKRYQIQPVWRAENPQSGRFREFIQADIDIVGSNNLLVEAEIIACALGVFKKLGFKKIKMLINDRQNFVNLDKRVIIAVDKLEKIGEEKVIAEIERIGYEKKQAYKILDQIKNKKPTANLNQLFTLLRKYGLKDKVDFVYQPTLARGLDYYTGIIFEAVDPNYPAQSLGGGGRYDNLIGVFSGQKVPACGFAFGFDRILAAMESLSLLPKTLTKTQVLVTVFSDEFLSQSIQTANFLRQNDINAEIYVDLPKKLDKQLKYADKKGLTYAIIIGPYEIKNNVITLKELKTGKQETMATKNLIEKLKQ